MKITMTTISKIECARFIYTKGKTNCKNYYIQKYRHLAKSKTICVTFYLPYSTITYKRTYDLSDLIEK